jgi:hypothetical protein
MIGVDESLILHEDTFYEYFVPYRHPKATGNAWGELGLEPYHKDYEIVLSHDPNYVWTVLDSCCTPADQWIVSGWHFVNLICYLVTERPHNGFFMEFRCPLNCRSLTPLGIKRQINKIEREMAKYLASPYYTP